MRHRLVAIGAIASLVLAVLGPIPVVAIDTGPPQLLFAGEIGNTDLRFDHLILAWDERLDERVTPTPSDFTITIDTTPYAPRGLAHLFSGFAGLGSPFDLGGVTFMELYLPVGVTIDSSSIVRVSYTSHGSPLRDLSLAPVADFANFDNAGTFDFGLPFGFLGAIVDGDHGANRLALVLTGQIDQTVTPPDPADFTVIVTPLGGSPAQDPVTGITFFHPELGFGILDLALTTPVPYAADVTLAYSAGAPIKDRNSTDTLPAFSAQPAQVLLPLNQVSATVAPGVPLSTSTGTPTAADPVSSTVTSPTGGTVSIDESPLASAPPGYDFFGQQIEITAPPATAAAPLVLRFEFDATLIPFGQDETSVTILRNSVAIGPCAWLTGPGTPGTADPTPCVSARDALGGGDIGITVLTATASTYNFAITPAYTFGGFRAPVDKSPTRNRAQAGSAIPVRFSLGGDRGLGIFTAGSPSSRAMACDTTSPLDAIESTVSAGDSSLSYAPGTMVYTYVWKTDKAWTGSCRQLSLHFGNGLTATTLFDFKK